MDSVLSLPRLWQNYIAVNQSFADAIRDVYEDGDVIWVHDYHLLLLPSQVRTALPHAKVIT
jgi:trehalose 6-phosphate synthase complex regulatory subunit